jgi:hypothetical protein
LKTVDFSEGSPTRKLTLNEQSALMVDGKFISGEASGYFVPTDPFLFVGAEG